MNGKAEISGEAGGFYPARALPPASPSDRDAVEAGAGRFDHRPTT